MWPARCPGPWAGWPRGDVVHPALRRGVRGQWRDKVAAAIAGTPFTAGLFEARLGVGARAMLVDCPPLYHRPGLYHAGGADFDDNALRFAFLVIAALEWAAQQAEPIDVVHAHDWQAGLVPAYLRQHSPGIPRWARSRRCSRSTTWRTRESSTRRGCRGSAWLGTCSPSNGLEFWDRISLLKAGVNFADAITTVSPTYAKEIQRPRTASGSTACSAPAPTRSPASSTASTSTRGARARPAPAGGVQRQVAGRQGRREARGSAGLRAPADTPRWPGRSSGWSRGWSAEGLRPGGAVPSELADLDAGVGRARQRRQPLRAQCRRLAMQRPSRIGAVSASTNASRT